MGSVSGRCALHEQVARHRGGAAGHMLGGARMVQLGAQHVAAHVAGQGQVHAGVWRGRRGQGAGNFQRAHKGVAALGVHAAKHVLAHQGRHLLAGADHAGVPAVRARQAHGFLVGPLELVLGLCCLVTAMHAPAFKGTRLVGGLVQVPAGNQRGLGPLRIAVNEVDAPAHGLLLLSPGRQCRRRPAPHGPVHGSGPCPSGESAGRSCWSCGPLPGPCRGPRPARSWPGAGGWVFHAPGARPNRSACV